MCRPKKAYVQVTVAHWRRGHCCRGIIYTSDANTGNGKPSRWSTGADHCSSMTARLASWIDADASWKMLAIDRPGLDRKAGARTPGMSRPATVLEDSVRYWVVNRTRYVSVRGSPRGWPSWRQNSVWALATRTLLVASVGVVRRRPHPEAFDNLAGAYDPRTRKSSRWRFLPAVPVSLFWCIKDILGVISHVVIVEQRNERRRKENSSRIICKNIQ